MRVFVLALSCLLLSGCLSKMEKVTEDTRDQVKRSLDRQTGSGVLELLSPDLDPSQKSAAFLRYMTTPDAFPLEKMHVYFGMIKPITDNDLFVANETPNVIYIGKRSDPRRLIDPISEETYETILSCTQKMLGALLKGVKNYEEYDRSIIIPRIVLLAPHVFGARYVESNEFYDKEPRDYRDPDSLQPKTLASKYYRTQGANYLMKLSATDEVSDTLREVVMDRIERLMDINPHTLDLDVD